MPGEAQLRILVVEDDADTADVLRHLLSGQGHLVEIASSGLEGIELARRFAPDVVICDLNLAGSVDGLAVAAALRSDAALKGARRIAFTAHPGLDRVARHAGFDEYLMKPRDLPRLLTMIRDAPRLPRGS
jgi:CheY-like chemotaxis protein